jgi:ankyrin repeat protein
MPYYAFGRDEDLYERERKRELRLMDALMSAIHEDAFPTMIDPKRAKMMHWYDYPDNLESIFHCQGDTEVGEVINDVDDQGDTPLTYACTIAASDTIMELKAQGADLALADGKGRTALIAAAQNKDKERSVDVMEYLLQTKAFKKRRTHSRWTMNSEADNEGNTALIYAAGLGNLEVVEILIGEEDVPGRRDCVNIVNKKGDTALSMAALNSHDAVVNFLLCAGAKVTGTAGARALLHSISKGRTEMTDAILASRKDWGRAKEDDVMLRVAAADEHGHLLIGKLMERVLACVEGGDTGPGTGNAVGGGSAVRDETEVVCLN